MNYYISPYAAMMGNKANGVVYPETEWKAVCHQKEEFIWINYKGTRETSRWVSVERKLPYLVEVKRAGNYASHEISAHRTLEAAIRAAEKY